MKIATLLCDECDNCYPAKDGWIICLHCGGMLDYLTVEILLDATWKHYKDPLTIKNWIYAKRGLTIEPPITWWTHG